MTTYSEEDLKKTVTFSSTLNLWTNTWVIWEVLRAMLITIALFFVMMLLISGFDFGFAVMVSGVTGGIILGLTFLAYYGVYCPLNRGKMQNTYIMDDKQITGYMGVKNAQTADKLTAATIVVGILAGNPGTAGAGMLSSRREMTTRYRDIKRITVKRRRSLVILAAGLDRNVIFVPDGYLDVVAGTLIQQAGEGVKVRGLVAYGG